MKAIIAGIDPGTTSAYALLDSHGNVLKVKSSRKFSLSRMISEIIEHGNPVLVGCDKNPAPSFVEKLATKMGAKLVVPEQDLQIREKKEIVDIETNNDHELDAVASARHALGQYKGLFDKVDKALNREGKLHLSDEVKQMVVEGMSIHQALQSLEEEEEPEQEKVKVEVIRPTKELEEMQKKVTLLEQKNSNLRKELVQARKENSRLKKRIEGMPVDKVVREKEDTIRKLGSKLDNKDQQIKRLRDVMRELKDFISDSTDKVVLKKLKNLSRKEWNARRWELKKGDVLLVDDPNVAADEVVAELKGKVEIIVHKNMLSISKGFSYIHAKDMDLVEKADFALANNRDIDNALARKDVLRRVVLDYKKKRLN